MIPNDEQVKELWEWCEARCVKCGHRISTKIAPDMCCCHSYELDLDLNSLFKWAVPKLKMYELNAYNDDGNHVACVTLEEDGGWQGAVNKDPTLALFWAIMKVIDGNNTPAEH